MNNRFEKAGNGKGTEIMDMGRQMGSDGVKKFNELKNSGILKKTRDWFYNEGGMFGDFDFDDDDFDAGTGFI